MILTRTLKSQKPVVIFILVIVGLALWMKSFMSSDSVSVLTVQPHLPFLDWLYLDLGKFIFFSKLIAFALLFLQVVLLIRINTIFIFFERRTFLPAFFFITLSSCFPVENILRPFLIGNTFLILALYRIFSAYKKTNAISNFFDGSIILGVGSLFHFGLIYYMIFIWVCLLVLRPMRIREWFATIAGLVTPYIIVAGCYFLFGNLQDFFSRFYSVFCFTEDLLWNNFPILIFLGYLALLLILSLVSVFDGTTIKKINIRNYFMLFSSLTALVIIHLLLPFQHAIEAFILLSVPLSFLLSNLFLSFRNEWISEILIVFYLVCLVLLQIF